MQDQSSDSSLNENNILTCNVVLNLLNRFLTNIRYVGDPNNLKKFFPNSFFQNLQSNFFEGKPFLSIIIGNRRLDVQNPIYLCSSGWSIYLSRSKPCSWKKITKNPLTAIFIAGLVVGEVFKLLVKDYVTVDFKDEFIYDFITHGKDNQPIIYPQLPSHLNLNLTLVGCGAIGQAIIFALDKFEIRGRVSLIDPDRIDESNKQRYLLAFNGNLGINKARLLSTVLINNKNNLLTTREFCIPYKIAITLQESLFDMKDVIVAVDNKRTRLNIQAALPKYIWNAWTDTAQGILRYGVGKHDFRNEYECLACSYYPEGSIPSQIELNANILGISQEELNHRMAHNDPITEGDLGYFFENFNLDQMQLVKIKSLIGKPFSDIFHGDCGVFSVRISEKHEPTPANHVPVLAGTYAVIQYILDKLEISNGIKIESVAEFDGLSYPSENCLIKKHRNQNCICNDPIYQEIFKNKWGLP